MEITQMKRFGIEVVDPTKEQAHLLTWASKLDKGQKGKAATPKLRFASYKVLHSMLTEKRMALLEYLANNQGLSIRQLALELERDYKNVYDDVQRLMSLGLIEVQNATLYVPYDEIDIRKTLRASV